MLEIISQRKTDAARFTAKIVEWQTVNLAQMMTGLAKDPKQAKSMEKYVNKMRLPLADETDVIDERSIEEIIEQGAQVDLSTQPSAEALEAALSQM